MPVTGQLTSFFRPLVNRFPRVASFYRSLRDQLDFMEKPIITPWGFKLAGDQSMAKGIFEPIETKIIRDILKDVDIFVNVGANIGYYCCHALSMGKQVIAFEPVQRNIRYLYQNVKINGWHGAEIYPIALSNSIGASKIYGSGTGASIIKGWAGVPESYATLVPTLTIDTALGARLKGKRSLILIDAEGAEKLILEGAVKMLANEPEPVWIVEISMAEHQPSGIKINQNLKETFQFFFQNDYQVFTADQNKKIVTPEQVDSASKGILSFATHNFLFRK